jgi:hypothetical protein
MADRNPFQMFDFAAEREKLGRLIDTVDKGGGPPDDPGMEARIKKLEEMADQTRTELRTIDTRLVRIETRFDTCATKEDIAKLGVAMQSEINAQTWKLVSFVCGFGTALVAATYYISTHLK